MNFRTSIMIALGASTLLWACATAVPPELIDARLAYQRASSGPARQYASEYLLEAEKALRRADEAYQQAPKSEDARDLAYVAKRRVEIAESRARLKLAAAQRAQAEAQLRGMEGSSTEALAQAREELAEARRLQEEQQRMRDEQARLEDERLQREEQERIAREAQSEQERLAAERAQKEAELAQAQEELRRRTDELNARERQIEEERRARAEAEARARQAMSSLQQIAQVRETERGTVITLPGALLFASGKAQLTPAAQLKLDQVAQALQQAPEGVKLRVEGHTDSRGDEAYNQQLSHLRALAVRDHLVSRGVEPETIDAIGFGEIRPLTANNNSENRAANRRVEIVVESQRGVGGGATEP